jgi:hypothetical protein
MEVIRGEIATCSPQKALRSLAVNWSGLVRLDAYILHATSIGRSSTGNLAFFVFHDPSAARASLRNVCSSHSKEVESWLSSIKKALLHIIKRPGFHCISYTNNLNISTLCWSNGRFDSFSFFNRIGAAATSSAYSNTSPALPTRS